MRTLLSLISAGMLLLVVQPTVAMPPDEALARFVDRVETLSADFEQIERDDRDEVLQSSRGHLWLQRPGRFRWEVTEPFSQLVVADGDTLWNYDPDLAQATRRPAREANAGIPCMIVDNCGSGS